MFIPTLLFAFASTDAVPPPADHVLNPGFDTATTPWRFFVDHGSGGQLDWDSTRGDPALGSAHVGNLWYGERYDLWGQCVTLTPGAVQVLARVASQTQPGNACELRVSVLDQPNCNVDAHVLREFFARNTLNDGSFEQLSAAGTAPAGTGAAFIALGHVRDTFAPIGASDCWFDNVGFVGDVVFAGRFEP
jgi:hypothetical protein